MSEQWREIPGYESRYWASDLGRIKSIRRILKPWLTGGYQTVSLCLDGIPRKVPVHRAVLLAFEGEPSTPMDACHRDGNEADNALSNLYWGTRSENILDQVGHGRHNNARKTTCPAGHPYTPENTYLVGNGRRQCKTCTKSKAAQSYANKMTVVT